TPNNPTGAEHPDELMQGFFDLAAEHGAALIVDETYRDFHSASGAPHHLFQQPGWEEVLVHLYSFSKVFRLTGHRVVAMITGEARLAEAEKFLDTVTICPAQIGQIAALHGLRHLRAWVAGERAELLHRRAALEQAFSAHLPDWRILGVGAYFAYVAPPFELASDRLAQRLVAEQALLALPGTMFTPPEPRWGGAGQLRLAFANVDAEGLTEMARRLAAFRP
ncbi:MAG: aminotransferase class I/II-fold pyridoxal phosphate-dependent enzyme, partial [Pseudomonadota bacterium]